MRSLIWIAVILAVLMYGAAHFAQTVKRDLAVKVQR